jgi:hypothetical protein
MVCIKLDGLSKEIESIREKRMEFDGFDASL